MCGIAGIWDERGAPVEDMRRMLGAMRHRGPEGAASASLDGGKLQLGFLALGFTDQPGSLQPLYNEDHTVAISYNGEVYDYEDARRSLQARGHRFRTPSDTEVLIHLYEEHGEDFIEQLNGEFAFALWDARRRTLLLVRDRYGVKPLFFSQDAGRLRFASECKARLALADRRAFDPRYFLGPGLGLPVTDITPFLGISSVRPGHLLKITADGTIVERKWYTPVFGGLSLSPADARARVRDAVSLAVQRRVAGDVPVALALSSGIDSAIVAALTARLRPDRTAFSLSYPGAPYDEGARAAATAARLGLRHELVECSTQALAEGLLPSLWSTEVPNGSLSTAARLRLTRAVRASGFKALTGGEAADESFGGYPYFGIERIWRRIAEPATAAEGRRELARFREEEALSRGVFWDDLPLPPGISALQRRAERAERLARLALSPDLAASAPRPRALLDRELDPEALSALGPFDAARLRSRAIFATFCPPALGDRVEMAASLEGRVPFLDRDVLALAHALPEELFFEGTERKVVLRRAFADLLPGFSGPPKHTWMAPTFRDLARTDVGHETLTTFLSDPVVREVGVFRPAFVRAARAAWRLWPSRGRRFPLVDGLIGYIATTHALHRVLVRATPDPGPPIALVDRS